MASSPAQGPSNKKNIENQDQKRVQAPSTPKTIKEAATESNTQNKKEV